jgi:hypothetical protein
MLVDSNTKEEREIQFEVEVGSPEFHVDDLECERALMSPCDEGPTDFQLVIEHRAVIGIDGTT